jgi:hypothetical protein
MSSSAEQSREQARRMDQAYTRSNMPRSGLLPLKILTISIALC